VTKLMARALQTLGLAARASGVAVPWSMDFNQLEEELLNQGSHRFDFNISPTIRNACRRHWQNC
jgi:Ni,Fe-hydrogenase III large subunit